MNEQVTPPWPTRPQSANEAVVSLSFRGDAGGPVRVEDRAGHMRSARWRGFRGKAGCY